MELIFKVNGRSIPVSVAEGCKLRISTQKADLSSIEVVRAFQSERRQVYL